MVEGISKYFYLNGIADLRITARSVSIEIDSTVPAKIGFFYNFSVAFGAEEFKKLRRVFPVLVRTYSPFIENEIKEKKYINERNYCNQPPGSTLVHVVHASCDNCDRRNENRENPNVVNN